MPTSSRAGLTGAVRKTSPQARAALSLDRRFTDEEVGHPLDDMIADLVTRLVNLTAQTPSRTGSSAAAPHRPGLLTRMTFESLAPDGGCGTPLRIELLGW